MENGGPQVPQLTWAQYLYSQYLNFFYIPDGGVLKRLCDRWYGRLTDRIYQYVTEHAQRGDPDSIIKALDRFNREQQWTFCLGDEKGHIVRKIVQKTKPKTCLELGTFIGYSAINAARELPEGSRYLCVEPDETRAATARKLIEFAGLQDVVQVIKGFSTKVIPNLKDEFDIASFDYVFIDHVKSLYKPDLILLEEHQLLKAGTVVVADNIVIPGSPAYIEYVRNSPKYESEYFASVLAYTNLPDGIEKSTFV
ncbi:catechol O-methyltransferase [Strongylocentrotus purpuratus]|uniref:catechol O-methyltransferase n=1 Tax=Strongylocentrotus purpuratus TaxID=7668 RepID=A0A7M7TGI0_STRPU|nr:catechol O-methyltransferase [Strongylocentrotus purpuratus]|eukprot:XP_786121.2 PREDICTED: catechol O-methyltransferase [Strongylocentrotus purpuratus]